LQESKGKPIKSKTLEFYLKQLNSDIKSIAAFGGPSIPEKLLAQ